MTSRRVERDWQGTVEIPVGAYYGAQTQRVLTYHPISGELIPRDLIRALGQIKLAAAVVNHRAGRLDRDALQAITVAAKEVIDGTLDQHFVVDIIQVGSGTASNMNANEVIAHRANEIRSEASGTSVPIHPIDHVNAGQSSNDAFPSAVHVAVYASCVQLLIPALRSLHAQLDSKSQQFNDVVKPGRTHLMDAAPVTLGQEFSGYARQVELGIIRIESALDRLCELPLGGTAVGTGLNAPPGFARDVVIQLREMTGLLPLREASNHFEAQGARDALVELSGMQKILAVSLTKIANDIRWMASGPRAGLGEIHLPQVPPSSSIMPAKGTPAMSEILAQVAAQVIGNDTAVTIGGMSGAFELNAYVPLIARNTLQSTRLLARAATLFSEFAVRDLEVDRDRCRRSAESSLALAAVLTPHIGYQRSAEVVEAAIAEDESIPDAVQRLGLCAELPLDPNLFDVTRLAQRPLPRVEEGQL